MVDWDRFGVHKSTVCETVSSLSKAIAHLKNQYIHFEPRRKISDGFYRRASFPSKWSY